MSKATSLIAIPLAGHLLVSPVENQISGWVLSADSKYKPQTGKILSVSGQADYSDNGFEFVNPGVKVDDTILYKSWGQTEWTKDGVKYQFVRMRDVVAIL